MRRVGPWVWLVLIAPQAAWADLSPSGPDAGLILVLPLLAVDLLATVLIVLLWMVPGVRRGALLRVIGGVLVLPGMLAVYIALSLSAPMSGGSAVVLNSVLVALLSVAVKLGFVVLPDRPPPSPAPPSPRPSGEG